MIGLLTAVIGDLSSHLGCTVGLKDTVTAIAFVALGTSIPGKGHDMIGLSAQTNRLCKQRDPQKPVRCPPFSPTFSSFSFLPLFLLPARLSLSL